MDEKSAEKTVTATVTLTIPLERIENMLESAGIRYWGKFEVHEGAQTLAECTVIEMYDRRDEKRAPRHKLTLERVLKGIEICAEKYPHHFADFMGEKGDMYTGDAIVQCACFGDLRYG